MPQAPDIAIATSTNAAYEMMQGGGMETEHEYELVNPPGYPPMGTAEVYVLPSPPAPRPSATVSTEGGTEEEGDVV